MHPVVRALLFISIAAVIISAILTLFDLMWVLINKSTRVRVDVAYLLFSVSAFWIFLLILIVSVKIILILLRIVILILELCVIILILILELLVVCI